MFSGFPVCLERISASPVTQATADQIKIALDAGKHVFCDKPLDTTIAKCKVAEKAV